MIALSDNLKGIFWMIMSALFFSCMVAFVKALGSRIPSYEIVLLRYLIQLFTLAIIFFRIGLVVLKPKRPGLQLARALLAVVLINCNFYAFAKLPIADSTVIGFSKNLFIVFLAFFYLRERLNKGRLLITLLGFAGILLIARPGSGQDPMAFVLALVGAGLGATMSILIRQMTFTESNESMMLYPALSIVLFTAIPTWSHWVTPTSLEIFLLFVLAGMGMLGQWSMIQAFRMGETTAVVPASYIRIVFATIIGVFFFAEFPDYFTFIGGCVIILSNIVLICQEQHISSLDAGKRVPGDIH